MPLTTLPSPETLLDQLAEALRPHLTADTAWVGMHTGGVWVMQGLLTRLGLQAADTGTVDPSFYRDDYAQRGLHDDVKASNLPFDVTGRHLILVDDVLHTGRSARAALNLLFDYGRPASVRLAVLVDRGGRHLPIRADHAGVTLEVPDGQRVDLSQDDAGRLALVLMETT